MRWEKETHRHASWDNVCLSGERQTPTRFSSSIVFDLEQLYGIDAYLDYIDSEGSIGQDLLHAIERWEAVSGEERKHDDEIKRKELIDRARRDIR